MGLAASQGRLLLLTARQSDLEYRAQQISQRKLVLATEQERISLDYNKALGNLMLRVNVREGADSNPDNNPMVAKLITLDNLKEAGFAVMFAGGGRQLVNADGYNASQIENLLRDGVAIICNADKTTGNPLPGADGKITTVAWQQNTAFTDKLNTADDAMAESEYEAGMAKVQRIDKTLDLELKNIETQHKAVETEVDSVKKVIQKNIEMTFKTFA